jgi:hypothetical protein
VQDFIGDVEPLLKKPFEFYGSYLKVKNEDRVTVMQDELVLYYKGQIVQKDIDLEAINCGHEYLLNEY